MKETFILFSPWLLKSPVQHHGDVADVGHPIVSLQSHVSLLVMHVGDREI